VRDESDCSGIRLVVIPEPLYQCKDPLEPALQVYLDAGYLGVNMLALVDGLQPRVLTRFKKSPFSTTSSIARAVIPPPPTQFEPR